MTSTIASEQASIDKLLEGYFNYPLVAQINVDEDHIKFNATYDSRALADVQVHALTNHFKYVAQQLLAPEANEKSLETVVLTGPWDVEQAIARKGEEPEIIDSCLHELIAKQAMRQPNALAVQA